jgi:hypothetical protein
LTILKAIASKGFRHHLAAAATCGYGYSLLIIGLLAADDDWDYTLLAPLPTR